MSSMLSALQLDEVREIVLQQTGGQLNSNSRLSQQARQLGWAIRVQFDPSEVDRDSLRNAANSFFYSDPSSLPPSAPASQLSSEPHSFSRVFSGAFLDALAAMYHVGPVPSSADGSEDLAAISVEAGRLLIAGVRMASVGPGYYSQVASAMILADQNLNNGRFRAALVSSFVQRGILSPTAAVSLTRDIQTQGSQVFGVAPVARGTKQLQIEADNEGYRKTAKDAPSLPLRLITTRFGASFYIHMPTEPNRFTVVAAALDNKPEASLTPEEDARSFIEDLIQLDQISADNGQAVIPPELFTPGSTQTSARTHRLITLDGKNVLKRVRFICGCCGHSRTH